MPSIIQKLREETGAGVMDCKKAIDEAGGDYDKAKIILAAKNIVQAEKKAGRQTGAGFLEAYIHNNRVGVLLEMRSETDFVVHSEPVKALAHNLALHIAAMAPGVVEELLKQPYAKDESKTVEEVIKSVIGIVGENIKVERFTRYQI